jgi:hypothetical protein
LNAGFEAAGDENSFKPTVPELGGIGVERVFAGIERGEAKCAVSRGGGADFSAGGLVAQNDGGTGQWRRMQVSQTACERTRLRRLNLDEMLTRGIGRIRLSEDQRMGA